MPRKREMVEAGLCGKGLHQWGEGWKQCLGCKRESERRWSKANPEKAREISRRWNKANPEKTRESSRLWREANPERQREGVRRWAKANPEKKREIAHRRRARLEGNGVYAVTEKDMRRLLLQPCAHSHLSPCNGDMHVDHVIPVSRGGSHGIGNLQTLCQRHNTSKKARLEVEVRCSAVSRAA